MSRFFLFLLFLLLPFESYQQNIPPPPDPPRLVNDYTGTLTTGQREQLESKLVAFDDSTSTQIAIVIINTLDGYPISHYAFQLGDTWGIGRKGKDNGAVILAAMQDREVFIATGRGLEGAIPDALAKRIVELHIVPAFRQGDYYKGLDEATTVMMKLVTGEFTAESLRQPFPWALIIVIGFILLIMFLGIYQSYRQARRFANTNGMDLWTAWDMINTARMLQQGKWKKFSSGTGSFRGFNSSGGFGGFGGGSFGGGGAGGRW